MTLQTAKNKVLRAIKGERAAKTFGFVGGNINVVACVYAANRYKLSMEDAAKFDKWYNSDALQAERNREVVPFTKDIIACMVNDFSGASNTAVFHN